MRLEAAGSWHHHRELGTLNPEQIILIMVIL